MQTSAAIIEETEEQFGIIESPSALHLYVNPYRDEPFLSSQQAWNELQPEDQQEVLTAFRDLTNYDNEDSRRSSGKRTRLH